MKAFLIKCVDGGHGWGETGAFAILWASNRKDAKNLIPGGWVVIHAVDVPETSKFLLNLSPSDMDSAVLTLAGEQNALNRKEAPLPVNLEDIEKAVYQATESKFGATNGFPTFTEEMVGFAVQTTIDYMMHHLTKKELGSVPDQVPGVTVSRPDNELDWVDRIKSKIKDGTYNLGDESGG